MTVGITDFEIKREHVPLWVVTNILKETLKLVPSSYSTQKVEAARFLPNIGTHL